MPAESASSLPPHAATAAANAARLAIEVVLAGVAGTGSCGATVFCTSTLVIVSTRFPLTAGEAILWGRGVRRAGCGPHAAMKRDQLRSNKS